MAVHEKRTAAVRPYLALLFLASCAMLAQPPGGDSQSSPSSTAETVQEERKEPHKPKPKPPAPVPAPVTVQAPVPTVAHCAALDAGSLKATINAKLDCIKESAK